MSDRYPISLGAADTNKQIQKLEDIVSPFKASLYVEFNEIEFYLNRIIGKPEEEEEVGDEQQEGGDN
ncbi:unnamed protein product [Oppiella nova]|uniref:Uncharacterized protein n=1 Tax=Oppiella nova TaxID=334625 RepID=A0A7R9QU56_9ACAR|nr:unnamed protein product [Oppiella nova]CAG2175032.1 unnamed protein product [Oppiella nova]